MGADLGRLSRAEVQGFGFLDRERHEPFTAPLPSAERLLIAPALDALDAGIGVDADVARAAGALITTGGVLLSGDESRLAHGDFDGSHVYVHRGRYAGMLDFGEVRGAPPLYDLAHWVLHQAQLRRDVVPALAAGYADEAELPDDWADRVRVLGVMIGVLLLSLTLDRDQPRYRRSLSAGIIALAEPSKPWRL